MRMAGIILILLGTTGTGVWFSMRVAEQYNNLERLKKGLTLLRGEIEYTKTPISEALEAVGKRLNGQVGHFFRMTAETLMTDVRVSFAETWKEGIQRVFAKKQLQEQDILELHELGNTIGYLDASMQIHAINLALERIELSLQHKREEKKNKMRVYNLLGVMSGVGITILIL